MLVTLNKNKIKLRNLNLIKVSRIMTLLENLPVTQYKPQINPTWLKNPWADKKSETVADNMASSEEIERN